MRHRVFALLCALPAVPAIADAEVRAYVDRNVVTVNMPFLITVEATGGQVGEPEIPDAEGLIIDKNPSLHSDSHQISIVNMQTQRSIKKTRGYNARAVREGKVTVPPIGVEIDGRIEHTEPLILTVQKTAAQPVDSERRGRTQPERQVTRSRAESWSEVGLLECEANKTEAFEGEPIHMTYRIWELEARGVGVQISGFPDTEGFYAVPGQPERSSVRRAVRNGLPYKVTEFQQVLYPTASGQFTIGPWQGVVGEHDFFDLRPAQRIASTPLSITVKPLPEPPPNFTGAVGRFTLEGRLSRDRVVQGVPSNLTLRLRGEGNSNAVGEPRFPELEGIYVSEPEKSAGATNGAAVDKTFVYPITPLVEGTVTIPAFEFCYFDPVDAEYKTTRAGPFTLEVLPSAERPGEVVVSRTILDDQETTVEVIGEDIHPIVTSVEGLRPSRSSTGVTMLVAGLPVLGYAAVAVAMRRKRRFDTDAGYARASRAKSKARKRLRGVKEAPEPAEALYRALTEGLADLCGIPAAGMTPADAEALLSARNIAPDLSRNFVKILRTCERARYASSRLSDDEVDAMTHAAMSSIERLDAALRKKGAK